MDKGLIGLALLGAVLVGFVTQMFVPDTPGGRTLVFVAFSAAFYPVARELWLAQVPAWRYWLGVGLGTLVGWSIDVWRTSGGLSDDANQWAGLIVAALATAGVLYGAWKMAQRDGRSN